MRLQRIFTGISLVALSSALLVSAASAGENCDKHAAPPAVERTTAQIDMTIAPPQSGGSVSPNNLRNTPMVDGVQRPTDVHEINLNVKTASKAPDAAGTAGPAGTAAAQKMKYVYPRPPYASNVVYCRPVPPATKCDDGGFMGLVSGLFGARSTTMAAQPGFPRLATTSRLPLSNGYKPPMVAVPVEE